MPQQKDIFDIAPSIEDIQAPSPPPSGMNPQTMSDLMIGVTPSVLAHRAAGAIAGFFNALPGGSTSNPSHTVPPLTPEERQGQQIMTVGALAPMGLGAAGTLMPGAGSAMDRLMSFSPGGAIQSAATKAGIPQLMSEVADAPIYKATGARPIMRAAARRLYKVPEPLPPPQFDAQFVESPQASSPQGEYQDVASRNIQRTGIAAGSQKALSPAPPPGQIAGARPTPELGTSMTHRAGLPAAPAEGLPAATEGVPLTPDPRLPQAYASQPAAAPTAPPGMMVRGQIRMGETGGIPRTGEQTVTPTQVPMGRHPAGTVVEGEKVGGRIRPMTEAEIQKLVESRSTAGRTARDLPKPTPPKKVK